MREKHIGVQGVDVITKRPQSGNPEKRRVETDPQNAADGQMFQVETRVAGAIMSWLLRAPIKAEASLIK